MTDLPRHRRSQDDDDDATPVDLNGLLADERALELLAGRAADPAELDDRTLALLAAWGEQARRGEMEDAPPVAPFSVPRAGGRLSPRLRGSLAGVAVTAGLLGLGSGVAAAVAGDPLAGLRGLQVAAVDSVTGHDSGTPLRLSDQAVRARTALKEAEGQARSGNVAAARTITQHAQQVMASLPIAERAALDPQASEVAAAVGMAAAPASAAAAAKAPLPSASTSAAGASSTAPAVPSASATTPSVPGAPSSTPGSGLPSSPNPTGVPTSSVPSSTGSPATSPTGSPSGSVPTLPGPTSSPAGTATSPAGVPSSASSSRASRTGGSTRPSEAPSSITAPSTTQASPGLTP